MTPQELKSIMSHGLLSFPLTDFDAHGNFNAKGYAERLEWLAPYGATALFAAGGTGEFFSLTGDEYPGIIQTAVDTCKGKVPIIAGAGGQHWTRHIRDDITSAFNHHAVADADVFAGDIFVIM